MLNLNGVRAIVSLVSDTVAVFDDPRGREKEIEQQQTVETSKHSTHINTTQHRTSSDRIDVKQTTRVTTARVSLVEQ